MFLCSKEIPGSSSNGSVEKKDTDSRIQQQPLIASPPNGLSQTYAYNNNNQIPPTNVTEPKDNTVKETVAAQPEAPRVPEQKNYSFYGMVPTGWQPEFSLPTAQPAAPSAVAGYNYPAYANPYYGYGYAQQGKNLHFLYSILAFFDLSKGYGYPYGSYASYPQPAQNTAPEGPAHTILKQPVNYSAR